MLTNRVGRLEKLRAEHRERLRLVRTDDAPRVAGLSRDAARLAYCAWRRRQLETGAVPAEWRDEVRRSIERIEALVGTDEPTPRK